MTQSRHPEKFFQGFQICIASARDRNLLPPHLVRQFHDHAQLGPLLLLGEHIALFSGRKAALRRQTKLIKRYVFGRFVDAAIDLVLRLQLPALGGDKAKNHLLLVFRQDAQRLEAAGAIGVELEES